MFAPGFVVRLIVCSVFHCVTTITAVCHSAALAVWPVCVMILLCAVWVMCRNAIISTVTLSFRQTLCIDAIYSDRQPAKLTIFQVS